MTINKLQLELIAKCLPADKIKEIIQNQTKVEELTADNNYLRELNNGLDYQCENLEKDRNQYRQKAVLLENQLRVDLQDTKNPWKKKYIQELLKVIEGLP